MNDIECKGVVVGTDGSFGSLRAVDWAAVEAEILGVPLTLCCVGASTPATPTPPCSPPAPEPASWWWGHGGTAVSPGCCVAR